MAHAVKAAIRLQVDLSELPLQVLQQFHPAIEKDVYQVLSLRGALNARQTLGGTAPDQVRAQVGNVLSSLRPPEMSFWWLLIHAL